MLRIKKESHWQICIYNHWFWSLVFCSLLPLRPEGGHSHWKVVWGCAAVMTPFFQASRRSLVYQFTINAPLMCPHFQFLETKLHCLVLAKISALRMQIFPNFRSQDPTFFKENLLPRPFFWKPVWHTPTKKNLSAPRALRLSFYWINFLMLCRTGGVVKWHTCRAVSPAIKIYIKVRIVQ